MAKIKTLLCLKKEIGDRMIETLIHIYSIGCILSISIFIPYKIAEFVNELKDNSIEVNLKNIFSLSSKRLSGHQVLKVFFFSYFGIYRIYKESQWGDFR